MRLILRVILVSLVLVICGQTVALAQEYTSADDRLASYQKHVEMKETSAFKDLKWQFLGPTNISGRVTDVAVTTPRGNSYSIYAATASGGVWKTDNEGTSWRPVFEHGISTSIGDVTISPSNQDIVWIGLGEANVFRSSMAGAGVYKSTDAGETWKHMGLATAHTIPRIIVHPTNPDIVYVADSGHEWSENPERGLYKTIDGGKNWERVFHVDEKTGVIDLAMDPSDPETVYAATWQRTRKRWNDPRNESDYSESGIHKSTDGGKTWNAVNKGLPEAKFRGRIGIDICLTQPKTLYAFVDNYDIAADQPEGSTDSYGRAKSKVINGAQVYRSDDAGETWKMVSQSDRYMRGLSSTYGWVFGQIRVDPNDPETIYVMGLALNVSNDGGKTFRPLRGMHGDHHALWINPDDSNYLINGNDGGINMSYDAGKNWRLFVEQIPAVQFFNVMYDMDTPFHVYGSIQDHGSMRGEVNVTENRDGTYRMRPVEWERAPGGEGSSHAIDPTDPNTVYSAGFYGQITRTELDGGGRGTPLLPKPDPNDPPLRGQWIAPFIISPHNPFVLYHGMNRLFRSMNRGDNMQAISPDLTNNKLEEIGDIPYQTISTISESPFQFGVIYVGTDDGNVHVTFDSGANWQTIDDGIKPDRWISQIEASRHTDGTVYMSQNGKRHDDMTPLLWKSTDFGKTWKSIVANIPSGPINVVREDPKNKNVLYVGTDLGAYVTTDGGKEWNVLANQLPTTFVSDLVIHPRDDIMIISTHGRGMWGMDVRTIQDPDFKPTPPENAAPNRRRRGNR